ncbi:hypothetical protein CYMTET_51955 [Cymbomonas tetramitiformis]|uniref:TRP C-terminal domain-containing protein n=1 Tax=Cymbomonas tetramitiformis TaxID=36881 RepID=A0AAE0BL60_9CHLO|nr:hypothetical protein CYMTET_51955 [Cymbomonas tetramitiformis]
MGGTWLWGACQVEPVQSEETSNENVAHNISVRVKDAYGETVTSDQTTVVELVFVEPSVCSMQQGSERLLVVDGVANFPGDFGLVLRGNPGLQCQVKFKSDLGGAPHSEGLVSNITVVPLRYCRSGEELNGEVPWQYCTACSPGLLSLDNSSSCLSCAKTLDCPHDASECAVECPGRDQYVVCQGAYVAPQAQHCGSDTACFLARVRSCQDPRACTTNGGASSCGIGEAGNAGRAGQGAQDAASLQVCNEAYAGNKSAMCGGTLRVVCADGHFATTYPGFPVGCERCGSRKDALLYISVGAVAYSLMITMIGILVLMSWRSFSKDSQKTNLRDSVYTSSVHLRDTKNAVTLVVGYFQVVGQMLTIYDEDILPHDLPLVTFFKAANILNLDFTYMSTWECFSYHFLPHDNFRDRRHYSFIRSFLHSLTLPWGVCVLFLGLYYICCLRRQQKERAERLRSEKFMSREKLLEAKRAAKAAGLEWRSNMKTTCMAAALFIMMFVHPAVSTQMFQIFNCIPLYFDSPSLEVQHWLRQDSSQECFTYVWNAAAALAVLNIICFVLGFPLVVFCFMYYLRLFHQARLPRKEAEKCIDLVKQGCWIPSRAEDAAALRVHKTFFFQLGSDDPSAMFSGVKRFLRRFSQTAISVRYLISPVSEDSVPRSSLSISGTEAARQASRHWRKKAAASRLNVVDLFMLTSTFAPMSEDDEDEATPTEPGRSAGSADGLIRKRMRLKDGRVIDDVHCRRRVELGRYGQINSVPITRLDAIANRKVLGQFYDEFYDRVYFWQCYEILRRMLQTGMVVVVNMLLGDYMALTYGLTISAFSIVLHQRYCPYKHVALDDLQMTILVNQFGIQMMLLMMVLEPESKQLIGLVGLVMQVITLSVSMTLFFPAFRPLFKDLYNILDRRSQIRQEFMETEETVVRRRERIRRIQGGPRTSEDLLSNHENTSGVTLTAFDNPTYTMHEPEVVSAEKNEVELLLVEAAAATAQPRAEAAEPSQESARLNAACIAYTQEEWGEIAYAEDS